MDAATFTLKQNGDSMEGIGIRVTSQGGGHKILRSPSGGRGEDLSYVNIKIEQLGGREPVTLNLKKDETAPREVKGITRPSDNKKLTVSVTNMGWNGQDTSLRFEWV
jgi:hypothetical protein